MGIGTLSSNRNSTVQHAAMDHGGGIDPQLLPRAQPNTELRMRRYR